MIPYCILAIEDESDREFMTQLYLQHQRLMYSTIKKIVKDPWEADDVFQITLEKMIGRISFLRTLDRAGLINYVVVSCRHNAYTELQRQSKKQVFSFDDLRDGVDIEDTKQAMEERVIFQESLEKLTDIWTKLDPRTRYLLEAQYALQKSANEIAADLNIKPDSVRMALVRARKKARRMMEESKIK